MYADRPTRRGCEFKMPPPRGAQVDSSRPVGRCERVYNNVGRVARHLTEQYVSPGPGAGASCTKMV